MQTKKDKILNSALSLFVEFGFHGTPTSQVAKTAEVSNGILFHYFKTKEELITELYIYIKDDLMNFLDSKLTPNSTTEWRIKELLIFTVLWWLENKDKYHYIQQIHFSPHIYDIEWSLQEKYIKPYLDAVERLKSDNIIKNLPTYLVLSILNGQMNAICEYYFTQQNYSIKDIEDTIGIIWNTIKVK